MLRSSFVLCLAAAMALTAIPAFAGGWARIASEGEDMTMEYDGAKLRMSVSGQGEQAYMLIRDGRIYSVAGELVIDASSMMRNFSGQTQRAPAEAMARFHALEPTGRKETVAGISGEVHVLDFTDHEGRRQQKEAVLSKDARVVELQRAFLHMTRTMAEAAGTDTSGAADFERALGKRGILRMGNDMRVAEISAETPAATRFELPAEPRRFDDFGD